MPPNWLVILPQLLLAAGGLVIFCVGAFWRRRPTALLFVLALVAVLGAGLTVILFCPGSPVFESMLVQGGFSRFFTLLFLGITALTLLFARQYGKIRSFAGDEFYGLLLLAALGMSLVASATHWVIFFLGLELLSLSLYVLIAIEKASPGSNEAGLKYFIMGAVASAFLTFGIALLYAATGTLEIGLSMTAAMSPSDLPGLLLALCFILIGIGFKVSLVPFHLWTPDVYQGAPAPVSAFLSTGSKIALFAALVRFSLVLGEPAWAYCLPVLWVLATLTMAVGNITALYQFQVKRLLAYSSVGQMGYLLMGLTAVKQGSLAALMFFLTVYAVMDLGAFGIVGTLSGKQEDLDDLKDFQGLGYTQPWRAAILAVCLFSLAGLPPTAGFMGKFILFRAVLQGNYVGLAIIGILTVIISIFFYLKVVVSLYMQPPDRDIPIPQADLSIRFACTAILILIFWLGIAPSPWFAVIDRIVSSLPVLT
jgi:NADH-quinone oxidoreductase subunit N